ncbi:MAG: M42 family metallopeptidase [Anaerolineae bacterium]
MSDLTEHLGLLSNAPGVSGDEIEVRRVIRPLIADHVDELRIDAVGNLITKKTGTGNSSLRVLITAHMDEVGLMVVGHTKEGALRIRTIGGIPSRLLPGLTVRVGSDALPGVIGVQAIHRTNSSDRKKTPPIDQLTVDIGAKDQEDAESVAPLGTPIVFSTQFQRIEESCLGKAFDDRAGCATLVELLRGERFPFDLYGVFTVQEEVGLRGARVAAYAVEPDIGVALEGTLADDLPKEEPDVSPTTELGRGPAITAMDRSYITPPRLLRHFVQTAESEGITYQIKQPGIGGTDAGGIHRAREGVPAITIAVPCRYIHSPISLLRERDLSGLYHLVDSAVRRFTQELAEPT